MNSREALSYINWELHQEKEELKKRENLNEHDLAIISRYQRMSQITSDYLNNKICECILVMELHTSRLDFHFYPFISYLSGHLRDYLERSKAFWKHQKEKSQKGRILVVVNRDGERECLNL